MHPLLLFLVVWGSSSIAFRLLIALFVPILASAPLDPTSFHFKTLVSYYKASLSPASFFAIILHLCESSLRFVVHLFICRSCFLFRDCMRPCGRGFEFHRRHQIVYAISSDAFHILCQLETRIKSQGTHVLYQLLFIIKKTKSPLEHTPMRVSHHW